MRYVAMAVLMALAVILSDFFSEPQQLGWLAQKQVQARHEAAQTLRQRMAR